MVKSHNSNIVVVIVAVVFIFLSFLAYSIGQNSGYDRASTLFKNEMDKWKEQATTCQSDLNSKIVESSGRIRDLQTANDDLSKKLGQCSAKLENAENATTELNNQIIKHMYNIKIDTAFLALAFLLLLHFSIFDIKLEFNFKLGNKVYIFLFFVIFLVIFLWFFVF